MRRLISCVLCFVAALAGCAQRPLELNGDMNGPISDMLTIAESLSATFARCALAVTPDSTSAFTTGGGVGGSLALAQSGPALSMTYTDAPDGIMQSLPFSLSADALGSLAHSEELTEFSAACAEDVVSPASMQVDAGNLQYQTGTAFVALMGTLTATGACSTASSAVSYALVCDQASTAVDLAPPPTSTALLLAGQYACQSIVDGIRASDQGVSIGSGTLVLTQDGSMVTVEYGGDAYLSGTLQLTATSATTALVKGQQAVTSAGVAPATALGSPIASLPVAAGALAIFGSQLTLSVTGTAGADAPCPDTYTAAMLTCSLM